jgi:dCTP deaminase
MSMLLSGDDIRAGVIGGNFHIEPFDEVMVKPASYVLRLSNQWREWTAGSGTVDVWSRNAADQHLTDVRTSPEICLSPGALILGATLETIALPQDIVGLLVPLSHLARFGLSPHLGSAMIAPGYGWGRPARLTLELASFNPCPLRFPSGMPVCHLLLARLSQSSKLSGPLAKSIYSAFDAPSVPLLYEEMGALVECGEHASLDQTKPSA